MPASTAPHTSDTPARGSTPGEHRRHLGDQPPQGVDQVRREVRPRGVTAGARQRDLDLSHAAVIGPTRRPIVPTSQRRVAVQRKRRSAAVEPARRDHVERAAGHRLLGRLEDQPDPAGQPARAAISASASPPPSRTVVCTSCPQAWHTPSTVER